MMDTVKNAFHTIGDRGGSLARTVGCETADLAKRVGSSTADFAKRIGPKRGLIGLAALVAVVGGSIVLVRYLRSRDDESVREGLDEELGNEELPTRGRRNRRARGSYANAETIR